MPLVEIPVSRVLNSSVKLAVAETSAAPIGKRARRSRSLGGGLYIDGGSSLIDGRRTRATDFPRFTCNILELPDRPPLEYAAKNAQQAAQKCFYSFIRFASKTDPSVKSRYLQSVSDDALVEFSDVVKSFHGVPADIRARYVDRMMEIFTPSSVTNAPQNQTLTVQVKSLTHLYQFTVGYAQYPRVTEVSIAKGIYIMTVATLQSMEELS